MSIVDIQRRLLTLDEVAERLRVTRRTVERKIKRGELPALQLGGKRTALRVDLFTLSRRMGTSLAMIDATYGHLAPDADERERLLLDAFDNRHEEAAGAP